MTDLNANTVTAADVLGLRAIATDEGNAVLVAYCDLAAAWHETRTVDGHGLLTGPDGEVCSRTEARQVIADEITRRYTQMAAVWRAKSKIKLAELTRLTEDANGYAESAVAHQPLQPPGVRQPLDCADCEALIPDRDVEPRTGFDHALRSLADAGIVVGYMGKEGCARQVTFSLEVHGTGPTVRLPIGVAADLGRVLRQLAEDEDVRSRKRIAGIVLRSSGLER